MRWQPATPAMMAWRYQSPGEDSGRWDDFAFREGDIVISTRARSGTTWTQLICALLIFQDPLLPAPLAQLSPWLDSLGTPWGRVQELLTGQRHRRFIKTHTPLDGIPLDPRVTYIVTARHPLDVGVSLYHHAENVDADRMGELIGLPPREGPPHKRGPLREFLLRWLAMEGEPRELLDSVPGILWHVGDAWARRAEPNVVLLHYDRLLADLEGEMRALAGRLNIAVPEHAWPRLVPAATLAGMRAQADQLVPDGGIIKSSAEFFRRGRSGASLEVLTPGEIAAYHARAAALAPADLLGWLHGGGRETPGPAAGNHGTDTTGHLGPRRR
jgi:aryl sulfotransferase